MLVVECALFDERNKLYIQHVRVTELLQNKSMDALRSVTYVLIFRKLSKHAVCVCYSFEDTDLRAFR